jgi:cation diffusion facilitator family transporter
MAGARIAVYGALAANVAIAVTKFVVAAVTGSSAMASEGIHSTVDTGNSLLLLVGIRLSEREASLEHPFGHGKELYFWGLIVAVLIFGVGGGLSAYTGFMRVLNPVRMQNVFWNYVVLAAAFVFEGASLSVAMRQFLREKGDRPFWQALRGSKDPATYTVVAEDSAALAGLVIAAIGVFIADRFDLPVADGVASMMIGLLLAATAVVLIHEARGLLIGEGLRRDTLEALRALVAQDAMVCRVGRMLSMYIGPEEVLLTFDVQFQPDASAVDVAGAIARLESAIRERYPRITRIYIEPRAEVSSPPRLGVASPAPTRASD